MRLKYNAELEDQLALCDYLCLHSPKLRKTMQRQRGGLTALGLLATLLALTRFVFLARRSRI